MGRRPHAPAAVIVHGFPSGTIMAEFIGSDLPELGDRMAATMGWHVVCPRLRGCGKSEGDFSLGGWVLDVGASIDFLAENQPDAEVWLVGFGTGGAVCLEAAGADPRVRGAAVLGSPADFEDWANRPDQLIVHSRKVRVIEDPAFPQDRRGWRQELQEIRAARAAARLGDRPLLVLHGSEDDLVPSLDARAVADAHGGADLRIIAGAGHQLRHDPRALAMLLGWLDRHTI